LRSDLEEQIQTATACHHGHETRTYTSHTRTASLIAIISWLIAVISWLLRRALSAVIHGTLSPVTLLRIIALLRRGTVVSGRRAMCSRKLVCSGGIG
jgi:hypothetical protein